jgi:hypothetical protein
LEEEFKQLSFETKAIEGKPPKRFLHIKDINSLVNRMEDSVGHDLAGFLEYVTSKFSLSKCIDFYYNDLKIFYFRTNKICHLYR